MQKPLAHSFNIAYPVVLNRAGKFEAPSDDWSHIASQLEDFELIIVTDGVLYLQYIDTRYTVQKGEYLLLAPAQQENGSSGRMPARDVIRKGFRPSKCSFYWMHFYCSNVTARNNLYVDHIIDGNSNILVPIHDKLSVPERALVMMVQLQDGILSGYDSNYLNLLSTLILSEIANQHLLRYQGQLQTEKNGSRQLFHDIAGYIEHEIDQPLKVSDIAANFDYNDKHLSRLFKRYTGVSLKQYILNQKLKRADFLLMDSTIPVSDIAFRVGYSSYHTFERAYVANRGMTPTAFRQLYAQKISNHA